MGGRSRRRAFGGHARISRPFLIVMLILPRSTNTLSCVVVDVKTADHPVPLDCWQNGCPKLHNRSAIERVRPAFQMRSWPFSRGRLAAIELALGGDFSALDRLKNS